MKIIFAFLFGLDTLAIISLSYQFLKLSDHGTTELTLLGLLIAIVACISLLVFLLLRYLKLPSPKLPE